jgi:peptidoglycan/LPS O-acetylase OafA/YrhL
VQAPFHAGLGTAGSSANSGNGGTQRRFLTLDALRGAGAVVVMAGHAGVILGGYSPPFMYLAVDMFFVLSGFVLAHVYDAKFLKGLTARSFLWARVARLYPVYVIGLMLGLISLAFSNVHGLSATQTGISLVCGLFALPSPPMGPIGPLFPLNGPFWSLFFEFWIANLVFALFWRFLRGKLLWMLVGGSALLLLLLGLHFKTLDFGWTWHQFPGGVVRVCFSFFAGVAISRLHDVKPVRVKVPSSLCLVVFAAAMTMPLHGTWANIYALAVVLVFFPTLIYLGAGATERNPRLGRALGDASYATYAIHRPLLYILAAPLGVLPLPHARIGVALGAEMALMLVIVALAWFINKLVTPAKPS